MLRRAAGWAGVLAALGLWCGGGCSDVPKPPPPPKFDPSAAAQAALVLYDADHDGKLDAKELEASPPLRAMLAAIKEREPGHDDALSAADIAARLRKWLQSGTTLMGGSATVLLDDRPLGGATVTFEPEPWLGTSYRTHSGTTNASGVAMMNASLANFPGIYVGLYRVKISKLVGGQETVPTRYNEKTVLGLEVADDVPNHARAVPVPFEQQVAARGRPVPGRLSVRAAAASNIPCPNYPKSKPCGCAWRRWPAA